MDALGSYPRMQYHHSSNSYNQDVDQRGSWFGLAISGLKFLIQNQNTNSINHNLSTPQAPSSLPPTPNTTASNAKHGPRQKKLHILGPSVFRKKLYDIPEYRTTHNARAKPFKTNARLTKQALQQFNGNFSNYWNQRSSLHSHPSVTSEHGDLEEISNAGSVQTNPTNPSMSNYHNEEHHPSMTSSQIIHPTRAKQKQPKLQRSRSYPLLSSAEYIQNLEQFSRDILTTNTSAIPSPPPVSTSPELCGNKDMRLPHIKTVHALRSSDSINSSNFSANAIGTESDAGDGVVYNDASRVIMNHFIRDLQQTAQKQKQWKRQNLSAMQSEHASTKSRRNSRKSYDTYYSSKSGTEHEWMDANETLQVISSPLPQSIRKKNKRSLGETEEGVLSESDWSNVSSNVSAAAAHNK